AERLHRRLLRGEAGGVAAEAAATAGLAVRLLAAREHARPQARAGRALQGAPDSRDVADVEPDAHDHSSPPHTWRLTTPPPTPGRSAPAAGVAGPRSRRR